VEVSGVRNWRFVVRAGPEEMARLYDRADIFLNASLIDNMPLSILEAWAAGLPVVTSDAGGIPFIVRHEQNGLMVHTADEHAIAAAALRLLRDPALATRPADAAREECLQRYTWPAVRGEWERLYTEMAT